MKDRNELIADAMDIIGHLCEAKKCAMAQFFREARDGHETAHILDRAFTYEWHINDAERFVTRAPDMKFDAEVQEAFDKLSKPSDECEAYVQERLAIYRITQTHEDGRLIGYPRDYPTALAALRGQEWTARQDGPAECPNCHERYQANGARKGHHGSCSLADLLHGRREPVASSTIRKGEMVPLSAGFTAPAKPIVLSGMVAADKAPIVAEPWHGCETGPFAPSDVPAEWSIRLKRAFTLDSPTEREGVPLGPCVRCGAAKGERHSPRCSAFMAIGTWPLLVAALTSASHDWNGTGNADPIGTLARACDAELANPVPSCDGCSTQAIRPEDHTCEGSKRSPREWNDVIRERLDRAADDLIVKAILGPELMSGDCSGSRALGEAHAAARRGPSTPQWHLDVETFPELGAERDAAVYQAFAHGHLVRDRGILYASYADWVGRLR